MCRNQSTNQRAVQVEGDIFNCGRLFPLIVMVFLLFTLFIIPRQQSLLLRILYKGEKVDYQSILQSFEENDESLFFACKNCFDVGLSFSFEFIALIYMYFNRLIIPFVVFGRSYIH